MNYPSTKEYKEAILFAEDKLYQLNKLRPVLEDDGNPVMSSGNFAVVFKMKDVYISFDEREQSRLQVKSAMSSPKLRI